LDLALLGHARWSFVPVQAGNKAAWRLLGMFERVARLFWRLGLATPAVLKWTQVRLVDRLAAAALSVDATFYIGHNLPGLLAADRAARSAGAMLGFDAEDDHPGEVPDAGGETHEMARRHALMSAPLRRSVLRTAASPMIADAMKERFGLPFAVVRNVFPLADATSSDPATEREDTIYWFSQTIGPGRGLEELLHCMAMMRHPVRLDLRGTLVAGFQSQLLAQAIAFGMHTDRVRFLQPAMPTEMTRLAANAGLGASVEIGSSPNKRACLGNKIFQYLLAGTPVLLTPTPAQAQLACTLGEAALLVDLSQPEYAAAQLDDWFANRMQRRRAQEAAWRIARTELNWEMEALHLLRAVDTSLLVGRRNAARIESNAV
jgi:hypothetical protein